MRKILFSLFAVTLLIVLGACGNKDDNNNSENNNESEQPSEEEAMTIEDDEKIEGSEVVADINGTEVLGDVYNVIYTQAKMQFSQLGQDAGDADEVKEFTLDTVIDQELLRQDAEEREINVSEEEVDEEFGSLMEDDEGEGGVESFLDEYGLEEDAFKEQISFSLMYDKYVESEVDVSVSDEEVEETYEEMEEQQDEMPEGQELPEFDEIKDQLRNDLEMQKEQEALNEIVEDLKEKATIETMI